MDNSELDRKAQECVNDRLDIDYHEEFHFIEGFKAGYLSRDKEVEELKAERDRAVEELKLLKLAHAGKLNCPF